MGGENMKALKTSYSVAYLIAKSGAAEVIGKTLVKPAAKVMVQVMIGDKASKAIDCVSLSNNTVHCRNQRRLVKKALVSILTISVLKNFQYKPNYSVRGMELLLTRHYRGKSSSMFVIL
ncbi:zinc finger BED-type containing 5, partial [Chelydra serpentina]